MQSRVILAILTSALVAGAIALTPGLARQDGFAGDPDATRAAMRKALAEASLAEKRADKLEGEARKATAEAEKTANEAAALAARIQQAEAGIAAAEARLGLIGRERAQLEKQLADRREPLVRLTAALQNFARRPLALSALRPGSLRETVYLSALLDSTVPQVRRRTSALRGSIARGEALARESDQAIATLREEESALGQRRQRLAAVESRQRILSRQASGAAARESDRALALSEDARDLGALVDRLSADAELREDLAALPGPVLRPASPGRAQAIADSSPSPSRRAPTAPVELRLPVDGSTIAGFGTTGATGIRSEGVTIAPRPGAQAVAPAAGRVAFSGPYRGFGRIVILEHGGGWTSLVTGLARTDVAVGEDLVAGAPLGVAGVEDPAVTLELRRGTEAVNPLDYIG